MNAAPGWQRGGTQAQVGGQRTSGDKRGVERGAPQSEWDALVAEKSAALAALPAARYPNLVECAVALVDCEDENVYYDSGVDLFLDGVRAQVAAL